MVPLPIGDCVPLSLPLPLRPGVQCEAGAQAEEAFRNLPFSVHLPQSSESSRLWKHPMPSFGSTQLAALSAAMVRGPWPTNKTIRGGDIWADRPAVVYVIRRMG